MTAKTNFAILLFLLPVILCAQAVHAETFLYKITTADKEFRRTTVIVRSGNGYLIKTSNSANKDESTYQTDLSFSIVQWNLLSPEKDVSISAKRTGNVIYVTGQMRGKPVHEKIGIDDSPWFQEWGWGLQTRVLPNKDGIRFWSLDRNYREAAKFEAKKERAESFEVNGRKVESFYVKTRLTGVMKFIWSGDMWFRKSDGVFLCSKMRNGPAEPVITIQLIQESR